jgi:hypothetical protein
MEATNMATSPMDILPVEASHTDHTRPPAETNAVKPARSPCVRASLRSCPAMTACA